MVNLGNKIKTLRNEKHLTQKQLAQQVGVAVSAISAYESGTRYPSYDTLIHFARIFHVSTDYLLGLDKCRYIDTAGLDENEINILTQLIDVMKEKK